MRNFDYMLDGSPAAYCRHLYSRNGYYLCDDVIDKFRLHCIPGNMCERIFIGKDLNWGIIHDMRQSFSLDGETK